MVVEEHSAEAGEYISERETIKKREEERLFLKSQKAAVRKRKRDEERRAD